MQKTLNLEVLTLSQILCVYLVCSGLEVPQNNGYEHSALAFGQPGTEMESL